MLTVDVKVNNKLIDTICIHNTGKTDKAGRYIYDVYRFDKNMKLDRQFHHRRNKGWKPLVSQVLKHLISIEDVEDA